MARTHDLHTEHLVLRPLAMTDAMPLHRLWTSAGVRRFLWDGEVIAPERTTTIVQESVALFSDRGFGLWGAWPHGTQTLVGFGGFWHFRNPPELELLFGVDEGAWGSGFGTEIGRAVVEHGFGPLHFDSIQASTDLANLASTKVLQQLGFRLVRRAVVGGLDTLFYVLTKRAA